MTSKANKKLSLATVIVSKDRQEKLLQCLKSIEKNTLLPNEIIIVNKGSKFPSFGKFKKLKNRIKVISESDKNLSKGRNTGVLKTNSEIICFTDDDCLVSPDWFEKIENSFRENTNCFGVFGQVFPYETEKHPNAFCPCIFIKKKSEVISQPCPHMTEIGYGNNMAFRADVFHELGLFKLWLSIGSIGKSAEDAEFALRLLICNKKLFFNSEMIVFHNRWLSQQQLKQQSLNYVCGETVCYGYFAFQGYKFANLIIYDAFFDSFCQFKLIVKNILKLRINKSLFIDIYYFIAQLYFRLKGLGIGLWYSFIDPIH